MNRKIIFIATLGVFVFFVTPNPTLAVTRPNLSLSATGSPVKEARMEKMQEKKENTLENLKRRGTKELDRRIDSLQKLLERLGTVKRLSADQKASLSSQITAEITTLTALKDKINADTDIQTLRTDVRSIVSSYRIYALYIPKIQIIVNADKIMTTADELTKLANKLEDKINEAQSQGKDVTAWQASLKSMRESISEAKAKAQVAIDTVTPLTPEGFPDNKTELQKAREQLRLAHQDLVNARNKAKEIMQALHKAGLLKSASDRPKDAFTPTKKEVGR